MSEYGPYKTAQDLADKIAYEGSVDYFFGYYCSPENFKDSSLYPFIIAYNKANKELMQALEDIGVFPYD